MILPILLVGGGILGSLGAIRLAGALVVGARAARGAWDWRQARKLRRELVERATHQKVNSGEITFTDERG